MLVQVLRLNIGVLVSDAGTGGTGGKIPKHVVLL